MRCLEVSIGGLGQLGQLGTNRPETSKNGIERFASKGPQNPTNSARAQKTSIGLASLILREACETIRCTEQHFYTMMLSHNRFLRLMAMHSILKKNGVHFSIPLVSQVVKMYLKDLYTNFYSVTMHTVRLETCFLILCAHALVSFFTV